MKWLWLSLLVVLLDQLTKAMATQLLQYHEAVVIVSGFNLTLVHNSGAAFSFLRDASGWQRWFFSILSIGVSFAILVWLYTLPARRRWLACSLALILGGAIGNLWDRVMLGYVIDFIDIYYRHWHWPAFNIADSAITVGAMMLIIDTFWFDRAVVSTHAGKPGNG
ncbi:MAG: signal peptidase II [Gammaproteobacteria bacterium]